MNLVEPMPILPDHMTGLYLIAPTPEGPTKIGVTQNLQDRVIQLQTGAWLPLKIYGFRFCLFESASGRRHGKRYARSGGAKADFGLAAYHVERVAHRKLRDLGFGLVGEWFDITPSEALDVCRKCAELRDARLFGIEDLASADLGVTADRSVERAHVRLLRELAQVNNFIRIFNAGRDVGLDETK